MSDHRHSTQGALGTSDLEGAVASIVASSATISERIAAPETFSIDATPWPQPLQDETLARWQSALSFAGKSYFAQRLKFEKLTQDTVQALFASPRPTPKSAWPRWAHGLLEALEYMHPEAPARQTDATDEQTTIPFVHFVEPLAAWADTRLEQCFEDLSLHLSADCISQFQNRLRLDLSNLVSPTLVAEFQIGKFRLSKGQPAMPGSTRAYDQFIAELRNGGTVQLFGKYPVLARLVSTHLMHWISFVSEFGKRLSDDRRRLQDDLAWAADKKAASVGFGLSDRHGNGRTCIKLALSDGASIFYKPKALNADLIFDDALKVLTDLIGIAPINMPTTLDRGSYGWVQGVEHQACQTRAELDAFHFNSGVVLFAQYLYGGSDLHFENLIACGPDPVVVDHECLMTHLPALGTDAADVSNSVSGTDAQEYLNSVLRVHMLPFWKPFRDLGVSDLSALGSTLHTRGEQTVTRLRFANTDLMRYVTAQNQTTSTQTNLPAAEDHLAKQATNWKVQLEQIIAGFTQAYQSYQATPDKSSEIAQRLCHTKFRYIFRDTASYGKLLNKLVQPVHLKSGVHAQIALEGLWRAALMETDETMDMGQLVATEIAQLMNLDVPVFLHHANECDVTTHPQFDDAFCAHRYLKFPAANLLVNRQKQLGAGDLKLQTSYIRSSFEARYRGYASSGDQPRNPESESAGHVRDLQARSLRVACEIADAIIAQAIQHPNGAWRWNGIHFDQGQGSWQTGSLPPCLYDGNIGIGLFLAATGRASGRHKYQDAAKAAFRDFVASDLRAVTMLKARTAGQGIGKGLGAIVYSLIAASKIMDGEDFQNSAEVFADGLCDQNWHPGCPVDVLSGAAGEVVALAALNRESANDKWIQAIEVRANHINASAFGIADRKGWLDGRAGLVHGLGGIANALSIAHLLTGERQYADLANTALKMENGRVLGDASDTEAEDGPKCAWCNGLPGIAAARLALLESGVTLSEQSQTALAKALTEIAANETDKAHRGDYQKHQLDHACCGSAGRLAVLHSARNIVSDNKLVQAENALNRKLVEDWECSGGFEMGWGPYQAIPTYYQGMAGIGYQLLRSANTTQLPDLMLFQ